MVSIDFPLAFSEKYFRSMLETKRIWTRRHQGHGCSFPNQEAKPKAAPGLGGQLGSGPQIDGKHTARHRTLGSFFGVSTFQRHLPGGGATWVGG